MDDTTLSIGAASLEIGAPACFVALILHRPKVRRFAVVILGATCIPLGLYLLIAISHFLHPADKNVEFAFYAMWVMTFEVYIALLVGATAMAFVPRPTNLIVRFFLGIASVPISCLLFNFLF
jgi:hypothetical protein